MSEVTPEAAAETVSEPVARLATLDDAPGMLRVLQAAFPRWPVCDLEVPVIEHLRWKMSTPGLLAAHSVVEVDGEIVALVLRWVSRLRIGDETLIQDSGIDHAVDPAMQGRGLGGLVARFAHEQAVGYSDVSLGTGTNDDRVWSVFDHFDPVQVLHPLTIRARVFGPRAFVATHLRGGGRIHLARTVLDLARRAVLGPVRRRGHQGDGPRVEQVEQFDDRASELWGRFASAFELAVERDTDYLNWRYCDRRGGTSVVLTASEADRLVGFVVFRRAGNWANVLDLVVDREHPRAAAIVRELLDEGCRRMRVSGARGVNFGLSEGHPLGPAVEAAGFLPVGWSTPYNSGPQRRGRTSPAIDGFYAGTLRAHLVYGDADIF